jgi:HEPN domain-containing protein
LAERARVTLSEEHTDLLAELNEFNIEGRYPQATLPPLSSADAKELLERVEGVLQCLNNQF